MTRCSRAANSASSRSWRSSLRASRSPTRGSCAVRSSPSRSMWRGKPPSSSPSRQTTLCGMERMGTRVHTVRWPVQKFARVALPFSRSVSSEWTSAQLMVTALSPLAACASSTSLSSSAVSSALCQASPGDVDVSESAIAASSSAHSRMVWSPASPSKAECNRSTSSARRPASSMSPLSTSSSGRVPANSRSSSSAIATPSRTRSSPVRQVLASMRPSSKAWRCWASKPHRTLDSRTHCSMRARSSSAKRNRRRTGSRPARSSTWLTVMRAVARSSTSARTPMTGLVWRRERSASRIFSWRVPSTRPPSSSCAPNVA